MARKSENIESYDHLIQKQAWLHSFQRKRITFLRRTAISACESSMDWLPHSVQRTLWLMFLALASTICFFLNSSSSLAIVSVCHLYSKETIKIQTPKNKNIKIFIQNTKYKNYYSIFVVLFSQIHFVKHLLTKENIYKVLVTPPQAFNLIRQ